MRYNTRKQRAKKLTGYVEKGPTFSLNFFHLDHTGDTRATVHDLPPATLRLIEEEMSHQYRLWATTWVKPLLSDLVPELKEKTNANV